MHSRSNLWSRVTQLTEAKPFSIISLRISKHNWAWSVSNLHPVYDAGKCYGCASWRGGYSLLWSLLRLLSGKNLDQIYQPVYFPHSDAARPVALNENTMTNLCDLLSQAGMLLVTSSACPKYLVGICSWEPVLKRWFEKVVHNLIAQMPSPVEGLQGRKARYPQNTKNAVFK